MFTRVALIVALTATSARAKPPTPTGAPPMPWLGLGPDAGFVPRSHEPPPDTSGASDEAPDPVVDALTWLGDARRVAGVDTAAGFVLDVAPTPGAAKPGARFEIVGAGGARCLVEVETEVRAVLSFTFQFDDDSDPELPPGVAYRGPGERVRPRRPVDETTTIVTPAELERDGTFTPVRWTGLLARRVEGTCPTDGLAAEPGRLTATPFEPGGPELADAVRAAFRANRWISRSTREYLAALRDHGLDALGCGPSEAGAPPPVAPRHLDAFATGLRTTVFTPPGAPPLLLASTGATDNACDPARAAIVYRPKGKGWAQARELWGGGVDPLAIEVAAYDAGSGHLWVAGQRVRPVKRGWVWGITALDKGGLRSSWGDWPDPAAHWCNYNQSEWEFAAICRLPE